MNSSFILEGKRVSNGKGCRKIACVYIYGYVKVVSRKNILGRKNLCMECRAIKKN